ncbi:unnamed protein product [Calypogeia fissa]
MAPRMAEEEPGDRGDNPINLEREITIPPTTKCVDIPNAPLGVFGTEIDPKYFSTMKRDCHRGWAKLCGLQKFIALPWTRRREGDLHAINEMISNYDKVTKMTRWGDATVSLTVDMLSAIFYLEGYGEKKNWPKDSWASKHFPSDGGRTRNGYSLAHITSQLTKERIEFATLAVYLKMVRGECARYVVRAIEEALPKTVEYEWLGQFAGEFWATMTHAQGEGGKYRQFRLKQHVGIVLDYLREGSEMRKSLRTIQDATILKEVKLEPVQEVPMTKKAKMDSKAKKKPDRVLKREEVVEEIATRRLNEKQPKKKLKLQQKIRDQDHSEMEVQTELRPDQMECETPMTKDNSNK